jgi:catechol 2,3-dioxygenase-like lactoylglutathione lyase family enzyme
VSSLTRADYILHHIGVACSNIDSGTKHFTNLGYKPASQRFKDPIQGIEGVFLEHSDYPRLEILQNLPGTGTLDPFLKRRRFLYHIGYLVIDIDASIAEMEKLGGRLLGVPQQSVYFGAKICFLYFPSSLVELISARNT